MDQIRCPACKKVLTSPKAIPKHTNGCPKWEEVIGVPPSEFNFARYFQRGLWALDKVEGEDYIRCALCAVEGVEIRVKRLSDHLKRAHGGMSRKEYEAQFPGAPVVARSTVAKRKRTTQERYGVDNVFQSNEIKKKIKETSRRKYGSDHHLQTEAGKRKLAKTNLERYGVENVFASEEIKAKIRRTMKERYGAENPQQVPEIKKKTEQTNLERYGASSFLLAPAWYSELERKRRIREEARRQALFASGRYEVCPYCDKVFSKITSRHKAICEGWAPVCVPHPCVCGYETKNYSLMKTHRLTCIAWIFQDEKVIMRSRQVKTFLERYGVKNPMQLPEIRKKAEQTNLERYGVPNVFLRESPFYDRIQESLKGKRPVLRGKDNPFAWPLVKEKILRTQLSKIGRSFPVYLTHAETEQDLIVRYGILHPMQDRDFARTMLEQQSSDKDPNGLERLVLKTAPHLIYTGDRAFWRWLPKLGQYKNPDFVLPSPEATLEHPFRGVTKVVEAFGDFWHSKRITGKDPLEHEQEIIEAYAEVGLECLVLWESEVKKEPDKVQTRLQKFLA